MREAIGGTWLTQLIIVFMLVFVAFLALTLNYTKAFKMKNEVLTIIEKYEGLTTGDKGSIAIINNYLQSNGYSATKACPKGSYGVENLNRSTIEKVTNNKKYYYCVSKVKQPLKNNDQNVYYRINTFFYFNLPVLGNLFTFDINGTTANVAYPANDKIEPINK